MRNPLPLSALLVISILALCAQPAASQVDAGSVEIVLREPSGMPAAGYVVTLDGTCQQVVSDEHGVARFSVVAAGRQTWSVAKELEVPDEEGRLVLQRFTLDAAVETDVQDEQETRIEITIEIKVEIVIVLPPRCTATPWCGVAGGVGPNGTRRVVTGGGVHGNCACAFAGGPMIPAACPGQRTVDPAPAGVHTITTTTCLGEANCALPNKAVTCAIGL